MDIKPVHGDNKFREYEKPTFDARKRNNNKILNIPTINKKEEDLGDNKYGKQNVITNRKIHIKTVHRDNKDPKYEKPTLHKNTKNLPNFQYTQKRRK